MKKLSVVDKFILDNLDQYEEFYMIITCQTTGKTSYCIITNLYCDPFHFTQLNGDYKKGYYMSVKANYFFSKFKRVKKILVGVDCSLGYDRIIYQRINKPTNKKGIN